MNLRLEAKSRSLVVVSLSSFHALSFASSSSSSSYPLPHVLVPVRAPLPSYILEGAPCCPRPHLTPASNHLNGHDRRSSTVIDVPRPFHPVFYMVRLLSPLYYILQPFPPATTYSSSRSNRLRSASPGTQRTGSQSGSKGGCKQETRDQVQNPTPSFEW
jgi:hypothetical protein